MDLIRARLQRGISTDQGTPGTLYAHNFTCRMLELPWRDNVSQLSCIPARDYVVEWVQTPKHGWVYHITEVPDRGAILIHPGNFAGDTTLGFKSHSYGCMLPCSYFGKMDGQFAGLLSGPTVRRLAEVLNKETFILEVRNA